MVSLNRLRRRVKDLAFRFWGVYNHLSSEEYISELESRGCQVGAGTEFFGENNVDLGNAHLISIGQNCIIIDRVRLLAHALDKPILDRAFEGTTLEYKKVGTIEIGDNVFLGERSIVLPDVSIGDNVIVGAGSVVTSDIPSNTVAVGVPCEVKFSLEEYRDQRVETENEDLQKLVKICQDRNVPIPEEVAKADL
jgi:maltose O-acetyltransferase